MKINFFLFHSDWTHQDVIDTAEFSQQSLDSAVEQLKLMTSTGVAMTHHPNKEFPEQSYDLSLGLPPGRTHLMDVPKGKTLWSKHGPPYLKKHPEKLFHLSVEGNVFIYGTVMAKKQFNKDGDYVIIELISLLCRQGPTDTDDYMQLRAERKHKVLNARPAIVLGQIGPPASELHSDCGAYGIVFGSAILLNENAPSRRLW